MTKYGIIFDSSCGFNRDKVEKDGNFLVPLIIDLSGKKYKAGVDIDTNEVFRTLLENRKTATIKTATPEFYDFKNAFDEGLKRYDELIFIGLSKDFSSTINMAKNVVNSDPIYQKKVHIYDSLFSAPWTGYYYDFINELIKNQNKSFEEISKELKRIEKYLVGYMSPGDIYWLYKGGRITRTQYIAGSLVNIVTILVLKDGKILKKDAVKTRTRKKAILKMIEMFNQKNTEFKLTSEQMNIGVLDSGNEELIELTKKIIFEKIGNKFNIISVPISPEQAAHIGPNSLGICFLLKTSKK